MAQALINGVEEFEQQIAQVGVLLRGAEVPYLRQGLFLVAFANVYGGFVRPAYEFPNAASRSRVRVLTAWGYYVKFSFDEDRLAGLSLHREPVILPYSIVPQYASCQVYAWEVARARAYIEYRVDSANLSELAKFPRPERPGYFQYLNVPPAPRQQGETIFDRLTPEERVAFVGEDGLPADFLERIREEEFGKIPLSSPAPPGRGVIVDWTGAD